MHLMAIPIQSLVHDLSITIGNEEKRLQHFLVIFKQTLQTILKKCLLGTT